MVPPHVFYVWADMAVHLGPAFPADLHRHFAVQMLLSLGGTFLLRSDPHEPWRSHTAAVVPSNAWHQFDAPPLQLAMVYLDPLSAVSRGLLRATGGSAAAAPMPPEMAAPMAEALRRAEHRPPSIREAIERVVATRSSGTAARIDPRIAHALGILRGRPDDPPSLHEMAACTGLSSARFRHLFRQETGVAFSGYRLWNRVICAVRILATSADLTRAAHGAGFADSAHFSRTFHRAFGLTPSEVFKSGTFRLVLFN